MLVDEAILDREEVALNKWWMVGLGLGLTVLGTASNARAEGGFELGARFGHGLPMGKADNDSDLSDAVSGMIPLQLDLGYRVSPALSIGAYGMYGIGFVGDDISNSCDNADDVPGVNASCSARDVRLGIQAQYHFRPKKKLDPWVGAGFGYEWLTIGIDVSGGGTGADLSSTGKGFEFINLQGGLDFKVARGFGLGPFLSFSVGQYSSTSSSCSGSGCTGFRTQSGDIDDKAAHQWLLAGVRGTFVVGDDSEPE